MILYIYTLPVHKVGGIAAWKVGPSSYHIIQTVLMMMKMMMIQSVIFIYYMPFQLGDNLQFYQPLYSYTMLFISKHSNKDKTEIKYSTKKRGHYATVLFEKVAH